MQILPYDYFSDHADSATGLLQLADEITRWRDDPSALTLVFDNGDFLQGNPLADTVAEARMPLGPHPMVAAFSALGYDAVALGNHEFNYGLDFLRQVLQDAPFAVLCGNIDWQDEPAVAQPFALLDRMLPCDEGHLHPVRIGVVGFVPPQVTQWDRVTLADRIASRDIVAAAQDIVPQIKAAGADIVIALCHAGIGAAEHQPGMENAAVPLAAVPGIDAILTGHTHECFPDKTRPSSAFVDPVAGRLHGKPAVGAGFHGNVLGMINLSVQHGADGWTVAASESRLIHADPARSDSPIRARITAAVQPAHDATLRRIRQPVARTAVPIHSYFACVAPDLPGQLLRDALIAAAKSALGDIDAPILAAVSPFRAGGLGGPAHYVAIPPGPVSLRDVCAIYPYADTPVIVRRSGAEIINWLEQAVSGYHQITPGRADQPLLNPDFPAYVFDAFCGLSYVIDLTQPPRHDSSGRITAPAAHRITDLRHKGLAVRPEDRFVVVANSYRAFGGGGFAPVPPQDIVLLPRGPIRDMLTAGLQHKEVIDDILRPNWRFAAIPDTFAHFVAAPEAKHHLSTHITHLGADAGGFDRYRLAF